MYRLWLGELWKTSFVGVPYKGGSEIIAALLAGTIDVSKIGVGNMAGQLDEKKLKVLALRSSGRNARLPDVPTLAQAGLAAFQAARSSGDWWCRRQRRDDVVKRIYSEVVGIIRGSKFGAFAQAQFIEPEGRAPSDSPHSSRRTGSMRASCSSPMGPKNDAGAPLSRARNHRRHDQQAFAAARGLTQTELRHHARTDGAR